MCLQKTSIVKLTLNPGQGKESQSQMYNTIISLKVQLCQLAVLGQRVPIVVNCPNWASAKGDLTFLHKPLLNENLS